MSGLKSLRTTPGAAPAGTYTLLDHTPTTMLVRFRPGGTSGFRVNYRFDLNDGLITKATLEYA
ncbi:hypothetical protein GCM10010492_50400 [Saccharothrix mutabilis subsp. mutabilis]|uniref:Uncharacterized protein n=1 Tax=Saccharothrix mutabilis subsp. mutabilis TaxID=66855 RepID=A0ABN0UBE6_9PSEU